MFGLLSLSINCMLVVLLVVVVMVVMVIVVMVTVFMVNIVAQQYVLVELIHATTMVWLAG